ncbi:hypothetical protein K2E95_22725 [Pseudomonas sp. ERGC3:01]|nr:hypothetical protein [Pseudomonas sp. ERGC3:01]
MAEQSIWLDRALDSHKRLMPAVVSIIENLIRTNRIDYLAVTGRVKEKQGAIDKIQRKGYANPECELTDISGVRIVVYFESDVSRVSDLITRSFNVDVSKSLNKDHLLSTNKIGYRSVHFVCDLGEARSSLPEFQGLQGLPFEFQVRTVLQHAWAELAHDRNYKLSGKLPLELERKLNLYAGLLEVADKGFNELSGQIDSYVSEVGREVEAGALDVEISTISFTEFVQDWCDRNGFALKEMSKSDNGYVDLIEELSKFGVLRLADLNEIIPEKYADVSRRRKHSTTIYGLVREWMLITDWRRFVRDVDYKWAMKSGSQLFCDFMDEEELRAFAETFDWDRGEEVKV